MACPSQAGDARQPAVHGGGGRVGGLVRRLASGRLAIALIVLATLAAYSNSLRGPFIFDDLNDIVGNAAIRHLRPLRDVFLDHRRSGTVLHSRPVVRLSLAVNYGIGRLDPFPYHLTNLAIHVLAALTLFAIVRRTLLLPGTRERFRNAATELGLAAALLWSLHPLQTAAVTYVVQRYESLMGLFSLLALYAVIRSATSSRPRAWTAAAVAATLLALGCKEVAVAVPLCILLYDRTFLSGSFREAWRRRRGLYLGLAGTLLLFAGLQFLTGGRGAWAGYGLPIPWYAYARTQPGVILHYLRLSFWPDPLVLDYRWPAASTLGEILPGAVVLGALAAATVAALVRRPKWGFLGALFFLILAPTSSVMPLADAACLHRMYLPLAAVVVAVVLGGYAAGAASVRGGRLTERTAAAIGAVLVLVAAASLAVGTWRRNLDYASALSIWTDTVAKAPGNARGWSNLGYYVQAQGDLGAAVNHYLKALEIDPNYAKAHSNLGSALLARGQAEEAIAHFLRALEITPDLAEAHFNLGTALVERGRTEEGIAHHLKALEITPGFADAHNNLGVALARSGRATEAILHFQKALEDMPDFADAHFNLGFALLLQGDADAALPHLQRALELKPSDPQARATLERALRAARR